MVIQLTNIDPLKLLPVVMTPSVWGQYEWQIIGIMAFAIVEAMLIFGLLFSRARGRRAELEWERLAKLAEAEQRSLKEVVANVPGSVWESMVEPGTTIRNARFVSQNVEKMLGYSVDEWLASPGFGMKIIHEDDRERVATETEAIIQSGKDGVLQFRAIRKDGQVIWQEAHETAILDEDGNSIGLRGVTFDITERILAEESLRQSEDRNRAILRAIPDLMFLQSLDGIYLDYHASDTRDLLAPPEEFLGKNMSDVLPPDLVAGFFDCFRRADETSEPQIMEYKLTIHADERWFEARMVRTNGNKMLSVVRDVTTRKRSEESLRQSEERFRTMADTAPVMIWMSGVDKLCTYLNQQWLDFTGRDIEEELGFGWTQGVFEGDYARCMETHNSAFDRREPFTIEYRLRRADGLFRWVYDSGAPRFSSSGEFLGYIGSCLDITDRKRAEEEQRLSEERLTQAISVARFGVFEHDHLSGALRGSKLSHEIHGWHDEEQASVEALFSQLHPDDRDAFMAAVRRAHDPDGDGFFSREYRLVRPSGEVCWVSARAQTFFESENGTRRPVRTIGAELDITERKHADDALQKSVDEINRLKNQLQAENIYLQEEIKHAHNFDEIVGQSDSIKYVLYKIEQVAPTNSTVLITGETGTGKELVARAIHSTSLRSSRPLVKVNCAALSAGLIESELFGHEKGSFTGATGRKIGRFELANGATIFLDEIGELPIELQVKLLRVIQEGEFERLGSSKTVKADVRIIAASNRNLTLEVQKGTFREDLWYRLNVFPITVPPLRQRVDDIPPLVEHFVRKFSKKLGRDISSISPATFRACANYSWPGNIRELANAIERAVINTHGSVLRMSNRFEESRFEETPALTKTLEEIERDYIIQTLGDSGWRIEGPGGAAKRLGLNPSTLRTRMAKLSIQKPNRSVV